MLSNEILSNGKSEVVDRETRALYRMAQRVVENTIGKGIKEEWVEDLLQEAVTRGWVTQQEFAGSPKIKAIIYTQMHDIVVEQVRKHARENANRGRLIPGPKAALDDIETEVLDRTEASETLTKILQAPWLTLLQRNVLKAVAAAGGNRQLAATFLEVDRSHVDNTLHYIKVKALQDGLYEEE